MYIRFLIYILVLLILETMHAQETMPIYSDYLTDNTFLIHPANAGIDDYAKIRLTGRKQWLNYQDAPELQTLAFHTHLQDKSGVGITLYNDNNGHFSQKGGSLSYAYHIEMMEGSRHKKQFTFALSTIFANNVLNGSDFNLIDSDVTNQIISKNYFNFDAGIAYRNLDFFSFYTVKNILLSKRELFNDNIESNNLRRHIITLYYFLDKDKTDTLFRIQPSVMGQYVETTKQFIMDYNFKIYYSLSTESDEIWAGLSYRHGFGETYINPTNYFAPFLGFNYKGFVISYTYSKQTNRQVFSYAAFHQISLGYDFYLDRYMRRATWDR